MTTETDQAYMKRALALARRGAGRVSPNPMVGAVIVRNGRVIGEGYHRAFGGRHAEINAIESALDDPRGADFYVTLEPCSHYGKTPPCVDRLIELAPARVVIGTADPNPLVAGRGIAALKRHNIATEVGILENDCRRLNETFFTYMERGTPFVTVKYAQTLDGRIASSTGDSRWISSLKSRQFAHRLRSRHDAVLVGSGTVLADDPELTVRLVRGRNPVRVVIDSRLRVPLAARLFSGSEQARTLVVTSAHSDPTKRIHLQERGIDIITVAEKTPGRLDTREIFAGLGRRGLSSVLVEGGAGIITSCLLNSCVDRLVVITAPRILGSGIEAVGDLGLTAVNQSLNLRFEKISRSDGDLIIDARVKS
jgi:diaminohydroxyphosphoribosylaminopyrimidine deaminase / 5-amino-6-(5-phosphoribosylamino)uracil reductase